MDYKKLISIMGEKNYWRYFEGQPKLQSRGQLAQDVHALKLLLLGAKDKGIFVDIGAHDGIVFSNTWLFEQLGWDGVCIEPNPDVYNRLKQNRNCITVNKAVSDKSGRMAFRKINGYSAMLSGLIDNIQEAQEKQLEQELAEHGGCIEEITVEVDTLENILSEYYDKIPQIDFCSIDVEGAEWNILKTIDFEKLEIKIMVVEKNYDERVVHDYMRSKGYYVFSTIQDDYFIKKNS